ncbi:GtrA family protein [Pandoraea sp. CB10b_02]|uniref:GtrA family protein n=1 Tax=Pandoraea sp. CB10b_02 TaxID=2014535 RepID=UPI00257E7F2F|nr:GtrA family protein [Pandoraea sp. CB10b_02]
MANEGQANDVLVLGRQFIRYIVVGLLSNLSGYLVYLLITHFGGTPKVTMTLLYAVGATVGFFGNRQWTFEHDGTWLSSGLRYIMAHSVGYGINFAMLYALVDRLGYPHQWVQITAVFVVAGFLFLAFRYFVFAKRRRPEAERA